MQRKWKPHGLFSDRQLHVSLLSVDRALLGNSCTTAYVVLSISECKPNVLSLTYIVGVEMYKEDRMRLHAVPNAIRHLCGD